MTFSICRVLCLLSLLAISTTGNAQFVCATNNGTITITSYNGGGGTVVIPDMINNLPVTSIGSYAFRYSYVTDVTIPGGVTSIGDWAFANCTILNSVTLGNGVASIGTDSFFYCLGLKSVNIPASVTSIGVQAFDDCTNLPAIAVDPLNPAFSSVQGVLFDKGGTTLIQYPLGNRASSYGIPTGVTSIAVDAFANAPNLTSITMPKSLGSIGPSAFIDCYPLKSIIFHGNAPGVGNYAFRNIAATIYYLPGTTGWSPSFAGLPAVLWNPVIHKGDGYFGVKSNQFGFSVTGASNVPLVIEATTDLAHTSWSPLLATTNTNGMIYFSDSQWTNYSTRFYRIRSP